MKVLQGGLTYLINEKEEKAEIVGHYEYRKNFLIPRSIKYESQEYIVQSISKNAFMYSRNIKSIGFTSDSEFQTIESNAFEQSSIESIFIPASVIDLKDGWCSGTEKLIKIDVDPRNLKYSNYEDKMIICKTSETSENYDQIVFCRRDIKEITIPSFIKIIGSYAFSFCRQLQRIDIPPHVIKICENAFSQCNKLQQIDIPSNSELQTIEKGAFCFSAIESIFIPASVIDLKERWCKDTYKLTTIKIDPRNSRYSYLDDKMIICKTTETNENYDKIVFCRRDIKELTIPSFIKTIGSDAFRQCYHLQRIDIPPNSELQTIEKESFRDSEIESIFIPPHVIKICENAFGCRSLRRIDIPSNSELQTIEKYAFSWSKIESIYIPPHVKKICEYTFFYCKQLQRIDIPSNSELQTIESNAFEQSSIESIFIPASVIDLKEGWCSNLPKLKTIDVDQRNSRYSYYEGKMIICKTSETSENYDKIIVARRDIKEITIPSFIKNIGLYAFSFCHQIQRINIPTNSELQTIEREAFSISSIESIFIPPQVKKICEYAFLNCFQLRGINIQSNSELHTIESYAFSNSSIESIFIPRHVTCLSENAFNDCIKLHLIEIDENSEINLFDINTIFPIGAIIMIPINL